MKFDVMNTEGKKVTVRDGMGKPIRYVQDYDSDTRMAKVMLIANCREDGRPSFVVSQRCAVVVDVHLPDSTIEVDGVRY